MKKKNSLKKAPVRLDLEKIEIDTLTSSTLKSIQGGYNTQSTCQCGTGLCTYAGPTCVTGCATQLTFCDPHGTICRGC